MECEASLVLTPGTGESGADGGGETAPDASRSAADVAGSPIKLEKVDRDLEAPGDKVRDRVWKNFRPLDEGAKLGIVGRAGRRLDGSASLIFWSTSVISLAERMRVRLWVGVVT